MAVLAPSASLHSGQSFDTRRPDISHIQNNLNGLAREALDGASDTDMADGNFDTIQPENEKEDVTILDLDQAETDVETRKILRADDCKTGTISTTIQ